MKMIVATIRMAKLRDVKDALAPLGISGMTVFRVTVDERRNGEPDALGRIAAESDAVDRERIEIAASDDLAPRVVAAIRGAAATGKPGDGVISLYEISRPIGIGAGEEA